MAAEYNEILIVDPANTGILFGAQPNMLPTAITGIVGTTTENFDTGVLRDYSEVGVLGVSSRPSTYYNYGVVGYAKSNGFAVGGSFSVVNGGTSGGSYGAAIEIGAVTQLGTDPVYAIYDKSGADSYFSGDVGIGTTSPSGILDVSSTTSAFLPPRMTTTQKNAIASPVAGMVVYDTTLNKLCVYTGSARETVTSS